MAQFLRPDSNVTQTNFTNGFAEIDESTFSDADAAYSNDNAVATLEVGLSNPGSTPDSGGTCTVRFRHAQCDGGVFPSSGGNNCTVTCEVIENTTVRATDAAQTANAGSFVERSFTFAASLITDWTNVRLRFTTSASGGSPANRRGAAISWAEIEAPDAAASQTYTETLDDTIASVVDGNFTRIRTVNVADLSVTPADTGWNKVRELTATDYATVVDAYPDLSYMVTINDQTVALWDDEVHEYIPGGDGSVVYTRTATSTLEAVDGVLYFRHLNRAVADSFTLTDANLVARVRTLLSSDSLALADAILSGTVRGRTQDDALDLTDALVKFLIRGRRVDDAFEVLDAYLYDLISSGALYVKTATDSLEVVDALGRVVFSLRVKDDTLTVTEATVRGVYRHRTTDENFTLIDALVAGAVRGRTTTDTVTVTDNTILTTIRQRLTTDVLTAADDVAKYRVLNLALSDAVTALLDDLAHSISRDVVITKLADDALLVTDDTTYALRLTRRLDDAFDLSDELLGDRGAYTRTVSDALAVADALSSHTIRGRVATDVLGLTDESLRFLQRLLESSDSIALTDDHVRVTLYARDVLDLLDVTDALTWQHVSGLVNLVDVRVRLGVSVVEVGLGVEVIAVLGVDPLLSQLGAYQ